MSLYPEPTESATVPAPPPTRSVAEEELVREIVRLSSNALGLTLGILFAGGLLVLTDVLVIKGGAKVGPHLQLLNQFFPGYTVSFVGSLIGAVYGFAVGYVSGWIIAAVYNRVVLFRHK